MAVLMCLVHFPDSGEPTMQRIITTGDTPTRNPVMIEGVEGRWRITDLTHEEGRKIDGVKVDAEITVVPVTDDAIAGDTGSNIE
jgi:hypothetical protein